MGTSNNIYTWSTTPGTNSGSDAGVNWAEGQAPATINDSARGMMAAVARWRSDLGAVTSGGSANAQTLTTNTGFTALATGLTVVFKAGATNTAAATIDVDGLGAKAFRQFTAGGEVALAGGEIQTGNRYLVVYDTALNGGSGAWTVLNPTPASGTGFASTSTTITGTGYITGGGNLGANRTLSMGTMSAASRLMGAGSAANTITDITLGTNLSMSGNTLNATGATGTVTSVATSGGISGGTITGSGTLTLDTNNMGGIGYQALLVNNSGGTVSNNATVSPNGTSTYPYCKFSSSNIVASTGNFPSNGTTWRNITGGQLANGETGIFIRVS